MRFSLSLLAVAASVAAQNSTSNTTLVSLLTSTPSLSSLAGLVNQLNLATILGNLTNVTILAPSNDAITKFMNNSVANITLGNPNLAAELLAYHVLNGTINSSQITSTPSFVATHATSGLTTNVTSGQRVEAIKTGSTVSIISGLLTNSTVTQADIAYNNGIVHIIDTVLEVPQNLTSTAIYFNLTAAAGALETLDLVDTLEEAKNVTIFVPNNNAFQAIASVFSSSSNVSTDTLKTVLGYHVVAGQVLYSPLIGNGSVNTTAGVLVNTTVANGSVFVNQAKVVVPNVLIANGVVHVIDGVLNPVGTASAGGNSTAFANATSAADVPFTSGVPTPTGTASIPSGVVASTTTSSAGAARAMATGAIGAGMLFAGAFMGL